MPVQFKFRGEKARSENPRHVSERELVEDQNTNSKFNRLHIHNMPQYICIYTLHDMYGVYICRDIHAKI